MEGTLKTGNLRNAAGLLPLGEGLYRFRGERREAAIDMLCDVIGEKRSDEKGDKDNNQHSTERDNKERLLMSGDLRAVVEGDKSKPRLAELSLKPQCTFGRSGARADQRLIRMGYDNSTLGADIAL